MEKKPLATYSIMALNFVCFFVCELLGGSEDYDTMMRLGAAQADLIRSGQYYRLLTSMFLHFGFAHLANNMVVLFALGENLEGLLGPIRFALLYVLGGLAGSLLGLWHDIASGSAAISAGASGAVFALLGAYVVLLLRRRKHMRGMSLERIFFGAGLALLPGFYTPGVDAFAHLGGFLFGILFALPMGDS
ncbi:MAG: rhomboid family intramembrane serine protease [Lachnospiraceae bacterium]|nr:rhomboid family intramembrane serine protease [Lachnospiraceae bacterium]